MNFILGILAGVLLTIIVGAIFLYLLARRSPAPALPAHAPEPEEPAVTVALSQPFLDHQMAQSLIAQRADQARAGNGDGASSGGIKLKLEAVRVALQPARRAEFFLELNVSAWRLNFDLSPVAELAFICQPGQVQIFVTNVRVGGFNVPRALIDRFVSDLVDLAQLRLNQELDRVQKQIQLQLVAVDTTPDTMILKFQEFGAPVAPPLKLAPQTDVVSVQPSPAA